MADKNKLEQLTAHIKELTRLTEEIYEREIYPVSFFSKAFDITNKIQEYLHQIEIDQIELFETQMKEHQAQILSIVRHSKKTETTNTTHYPTKPLEQEKEIVSPPASQVVSISSTISPKEQTETTPLSTIVQEKVLQQPVSIQEEKEVPINKSIETKSLIDLKKVITLNDRFRFGRELFSQNGNLMDQTIADLNEIDSYNASISYLKEHFSWDFENEIVAEFITIINKRFS